MGHCHTECRNTGGCLVEAEPLPRRPDGSRWIPEEHGDPPGCGCAHTYVCDLCTRLNAATQETEAPTVPKKLYIITRKNLKPGQQAVQGMHALREFAAKHPRVDRSWYETSNTIVFKAAEDEPALWRLLGDAIKNGIPVAAFYEPDMKNRLTALAVAPSGAHLCADLSLALR